VQERVCVKPPSFREEVIPAQYRTEQERVCIKPPSFREEVIPAEYRDEQYTVCVQPESCRTIPVPCEYGTRTRKRLVAPARWVWRRNSACEVPDAPCN
jgi:hypothetical protein